MGTWIDRTSRKKYFFFQISYDEHVLVVRLDRDESLIEKKDSNRFFSIFFFSSFLDRCRLFVCFEKSGVTRSRRFYRESSSDSESILVPLMYVVRQSKGTLFFSLSLWCEIQVGVKLDVGDWRSRQYLHDGSCNLVHLRNGLLKKRSFIGRDFFFFN